MDSQSFIMIETTWRMPEKCTLISIALRLSVFGSQPAVLVSKSAIAQYPLTRGTSFAVETILFLMGQDSARYYAGQKTAPVAGFLEPA